MYKIIGSDGQQYGPVSADEVRKWIAEGRLNAKSVACSDQNPEFRALGTFPEFAAALGGDAPPTITPLATGSAFFEPHDYALDMGGCLSRGYELFKDNFSLLFFAALTFTAVVGFLNVLGAIPIVGPIFSIANMVISGPLMGGLYLVFLYTIRREETEVSDVFLGFRRCFGQLFLGKLVPSLLAGLCFLPLGIAAVVKIGVPAITHHQEPSFHQIMSLLPIGLICLIPVLYLQTCWAFTLPLIIDKQMDFGEAMKTSWRMVNKHWWRVFGIIVLVGLINMAGVLACFVGLLFSMPIGIATLMHAYETIFGAKKA